MVPSAHLRQLNNKTAFKKRCLSLDIYLWCSIMANDSQSFNTTLFKRQYQLLVFKHMYSKQVTIDFNNWQTIDHQIYIR